MINKNKFKDKEIVIKRIKTSFGKKKNNLKF